MATSILSQYGANNQTIACSVASLANNGQRSSDSVDNTANSFLDSLVMVKVKTGGSSVATTGTINVYAYGTVDNGTTWTDNLGGTNSVVGLSSPPNVPFLGVIAASAIGVVCVGGPFSVAQAFGGVLPAKWGIVIENKSGAVLDSTESSHAKLYQGIMGETI